MSEPFTYGLSNYTGAQLLERQKPPNHNRARFKLRLDDDQQDTFKNFCTQYRIGGPHAIPSPTTLLSLADDLDMLHVGEADDVVKELLRRLVGKLVQLPKKGGRAAEEGELFGGTQGEVVTEAFALWEERNKSRIEDDNERRKNAKNNDKRKGKAVAVASASASASGPAPAPAAPVQIKHKPIVEQQGQLQAVEQDEDNQAVHYNTALKEIMYQRQVLETAKKNLEDELRGLQL